MSDKYPAFPKIPRLSRDIVVTEKIDGTNGLIYIDKNNNIQAGSRNRWIIPADDNYGFAEWVERNKEDLLKLGRGYHYGEWYGNGIQKGYGLKEKRFALFNTYRWSDASVRPSCCDVVPVLYTGEFNTNTIGMVLSDLEATGSRINPEVEAEGIIIFHTASGHYYKKTIRNDEKAKGEV